ncbi:MAG TPA: vitamin B12-dependent ribonucleotide reductase [Pseudomonadota bacterium]|nr:vitamin B12-dependent ribonucleotide reductase [Pseudomonadota bacterium]
MAHTGITIKRLFTTPDKHPYDLLTWEKRTASIVGDNGKIVFEQKDVEFPSTWSQQATNIVAQKYFHGAQEHSLRQLIDRVVSTITRWGEKDKYFASRDDASTFHAELTHLLVNQKMAFNSPVWFNVGVEPEPQCSACFINSVEDNMGSILTLARTEGMLFKHGSGTGTNFSTLRSSKERLKGGGTASGPVSFMKGFDAFAGVIKSGGKTRRAAKMVILNVGHPDVPEFIECKVNEERKAHALIAAGYDGSFGGEAYSSVFFQNSNNSVRVTDEFMRAVVVDGKWSTRKKDGGIAGTFKARDLWRKIATAAWECGDPGLQFNDTVNQWHTCSATGRINASNPCSEFMFLDDSACNLASLNLRKFAHDGKFDVNSFIHAVEITILAQEIIVGNSSYPTEQIRYNSLKFRPLGLGYANLGALLMSWGIPYASERGTTLAAAITSLMTGAAYRMSAQIAKDCGGPFEGYQENREAMLTVIEKHAEATRQQWLGSPCGDKLSSSAADAWEYVRILGAEHGFRNSQVTVLAPTGTIGFMMDCDTTGIEPDIALVKYKRLVGGGTLRIVNDSVREGLKALDYSATDIDKILKYIEDHDTIEGCPVLRSEDLPVFDCAFAPRNGKRSIPVDGHLNMMAAVQPFLSGAISKTVNLPNSATVEDIEHAYMQAWKLGLKSIAIYRDGCKRSQPVSTSPGSERSTPLPVAQIATVGATRRRLPDERQSITHKFQVGGHEGYIHVGLYPDGTPGELFINMAKEGSTISGLMDSIAIAVSVALQHGVPLELFVRKFEHTRFEPSGWTGSEMMGRASSLLDYLFRWLALRFPTPVTAQVTDSDAPSCHECGSLMVRNGACHKCQNCGATSGCS